MISNNMFVVLWVAIALPLGSVSAKPSRSVERPVFSLQDHTIIERNAALRRLVNRDPWLLRRVLDAITAADHLSGSAKSTERSAITGERHPVPSRNPDLDNLERSSPEAAHDLFLLIKKAGRK